MKKTLTAFAILAAIPAGMALADDDCKVPLADWQPKEAVASLAAANGWTLHRIKVEDGCYEVKAQTNDGRRIEAKLDPKTLEMIEVDDDEDEDEDDDDAGRGKRDPAPAGSAAPPANGLFGTGAPPKVKVN